MAATRYGGIFSRFAGVILATLRFGELPGPDRPRFALLLPQCRAAAPSAGWRAPRARCAPDPPLASSRCRCGRAHASFRAPELAASADLSAWAIPAHPSARADLPANGP